MKKWMTPEGSRFGFLPRINLLHKAKMWFGAAQTRFMPYRLRFQHGMAVTKTSARLTCIEMKKFFSAAEAKAAFQFSLMNAKELNDEVVMSRLRAINTDKLQSLCSHKLSFLRRSKKEGTKEED